MKFKLIVLFLLVGCQPKEGGVTNDFNLIPDIPPNVKISGEVENADGVLAIAINDIPYRRVFSRTSDGKYKFEIPFYLDSALFPVPDSMSVKLIFRCRNEVVIKSTVNVTSQFLKKGSSKKEIEFKKCSRGLTNKFFYVTIKDIPTIAPLKLDSLTASVQ